MAQAMQMVRNPPPRMLTSTETLYTLNHWKTAFRTYYRRDSFYKGFLLPEATWNPLADNYGQTADRHDGTVIRSAQDKCEDLKDFLHTIVGYLPFPYLTEKIVRATNSLDSVWEAIYEHYGLTITGETFLDFATLTLSQDETYRQFYDRLLSHVRLHLPRPNITVDGVSSGTNGDVITVALMNFIALEWLRKVNPQLVNIVKVEFSKDLRDGIQLSALVPRIAGMIDTLLSRNNLVGSIEKVNCPSSEIESDQKVAINKIKGKQQRQNKDFKQVKKYCPECQYLGKKLNLNVDFAHYPSDCPRPKASINLLLSDVDIKEDEPVTHDDYDFSGNQENFPKHNLTRLLS